MCIVVLIPCWPELFRNRDVRKLQSFNGWGSVTAPDCRGFTEEEFSHIDFSKIDFSEYIKATKAATDNKMQIIQNKLTQQK